MPYAPALPDRPPAAAPLGNSNESGNGRLQLDVVGPPARVEIVDRRDYPWGTNQGVAARLAGGLQTTRGEHVRPACDRTPCVLEMPYGTYELRFTQGSRQDTAFVTFARTPSYAIHAVGDRRPEHPAWGVLGGLLGATAMTFIPIGAGLAVTSPSPDQPQDPESRRTIGLTLAGVGVAALLGTVACLAAGAEADHSGPVRQWPAGDTP